MSERDIGYAIDILLACNDIEKFSIEKTRDDLETDSMFEAAIIRKLEVVGEVVKRLSFDFKNKHPSIAWKAWAGLRDKLIHGYDDVDLEIVWGTIKNDVPQLAAAMQLYADENQ